MRDIVSRIDALSELINDLMVFARPRPPRLAMIELHTVVADAITIVRRDPANQGVEIAVEGEDVSVAADGELLRATVLNLLLNAAQAMSGHGRIVVRTSRDDGQAIVQMKDTGPGIPPEIREQIFEPFFTTKAPGQGTGLGLSVSYGIVTRLGGTIECHSEEGVGTEFVVCLPAIGELRRKEGAGEARSEALLAAI